MDDGWLDADWAATHYSNTAVTLQYSNSNKNFNEADMTARTVF